MKTLFNSDITLTQVLISIGVLITAIAFAQLLKKVILKISNATKYSDTPIASAFIKSIGRSITILTIALTYIIGKGFLNFPDSYEGILQTISQVLLTLTVGVWAYYLIEVPKTWFENLSEKNGNTTGKMLSPILTRALQVVVIIIVFASIYQTVSQKSVTPFLASLGIVGAAIALSAQDTFKNFFGSFVMAADKPFEIGESIIIDGQRGAVENIGMRSTNMRTLDDEIINIPNGVLANKTILNLSKKRNIKRVITLSLTYDTAPEKMKQAKEIVEKILENHEGMEEGFPPRVFFKDFAASSLDLLVIYWYHPVEYWDYMAFSEKVNTAILEQFNAAGIEFAFPTQTIHLQNNN